MNDDLTTPIGIESAQRRGRSASRSRAVLFALIAFVAVIWAWRCLNADRAAIPGVAGTFGVQFGAYDRDQRVVVRATNPGSPFERPGMQPGDRVKFDHRGDARRSVGTDERIGVTWCPADAFEGRLLVRMLVDNMGTRQQAGLGSPGNDELRWLKPVYPGDVLRIETELLEKTRSRSRPEMGSFRSIIQVFNQDDVMVMSFRSIGLIQVRGDQDLQA